MLEEPRSPKPVSPLARLFLQEDLNFLVTNRIPRRYATLAMAWFSRLRSRRLTKLSLSVWSTFDGELDLSEAREQEFDSLQDVFVRELREGARPIDPDPSSLVSPCDAIVGASGRIRGTEVIQAKGFPYTLMDLLGDEELVERHRDGLFVTLRLKSSMYHRFHAPTHCRVRKVTYISGDTWNVNPIALKRVEKLFCKNERAIVDLALPEPGHALTLVPVAAILVAGIHLHFLDSPLNLSHQGKTHIDCATPLTKGQQMGHFQSGSTIVLFATGDFELCDTVVEGATVRVGQPLLRRSTPAVPPEGVPNG
ncbi:MAG: archaetidylserine decarboxylase [Myxococcaceae bacterium]|nr:archaetidylserine decarboxylase [Myxococcaceae bacterium]